MADLQSYVGTFSTPSSGVVTPQTITGIVDRDGNPFTPRLIIFQRGVAEGYRDGPFQRTIEGMGWDDLSSTYGYCTESDWQAGFQFCAGVTATNASMLGNISVYASDFITKGKVTAFGLGSFTYTLTVNTFGASAFDFIALGGSDLTYAMGQRTESGSGSYAITGLPFQPIGGFVMNCSALPDPAFNNWDGLPSVGFLGTDLTQGSASTSVVEPGDPTSEGIKYQRTDRMLVEALATSNTVANVATLTGWTSDGFTYITTGDSEFAYLVFGAPCTVISGVLTQPVADADWTITTPTGTRPEAGWFLSVGGAASSSKQNDMGWSTGFSDGQRSRGLWQAALNTGTVSGGAGQAFGGSDPIFFATPDAASTDSSDSTTTGVMSVDAFTGLQARGQWSDCDGTERQVLYLLLASAIPAPNTGTVRPIRFQRRFGHVNKTGLRLTCRMFQLDMETGVGLTDGQGSDPQVMLRVTKDGGHTWGQEQWASAGKIGQYKRRVIFRNLGQARDWGFEITISDPIKVSLMQAFASFDPGTS